MKCSTSTPIPNYQTQLTTCSGSGASVPTHHSMGGERGVSPGSPGQWTVVAITLGVGAGEGARPLPARGTKPLSPEQGSAW
ncbi:protein of unknown function [Methanoculleus bourgensis]|uniref:Uncharacterized protein n=1 Tax=Methanoculleus bourgensis TaxID=83986 RepID=A0A0X3BGV9_9EURY|nr:protein of unknown function [Methanoculleus bourgensis]